ncbi:MAG TPA: mechanosensitive ion channel domain-containing protein [Gammaproteobacteria bacterium]|nr:mechanosensitive ion channel domain-containing protein [Gammaproteobacteria bacterium]
MNFSTVAVIVLTLALSLGTATRTCAENAPVDKQPTAGQSETVTIDPDKARKLLEKTAAHTATLGSLRDDITQLSADLKQAKDEEQVVLRDHRRRKYTELRDELGKLVSNIVELESAGEAAREARKVAVAVAGQVSSWLKAEINDSLALLTRLDEKIKSASESDIPELRQQVTSERKSVDVQLTGLLENTDLLEQLGLDNRPDLTYLDKTLVQRAENLAARLQYLIDQRDGLRKQGIGAGDDDKKLLKEKVAALNGRVAATADNLKLTIDLMSERKLDTTEYKQIVISSTGEITKEIFETQVALGLLQQWLDSGKEWIIENGPQWAFKLVIFVLILVVFSMLANIARRIVGRALASSRVHASKLLQDLLASIAGKAVFLVGILIALAQLGIQIGPVLAGLGIVGFIIGFALQETLSNFAAGVMILIYRPFDVGDAVETGGISGKVKQMNLVSTTITTFDNQRVIVPNRKIWGDVIRNINAEKIRRVDMLFSIGYDDDPDLADRILHEIVDHHELALDDPPPVIRLHTLGESSVDFIVRPWVKSEDYWEAYWHITRAVKKRFDEEGISIPFPQQDMHIYTHDPESDAKGTARLL